MAFFINAQQQKMHFNEAGQGFPLILVHGYLLNNHMWSSQVEALKPHFRCISVDLWGHGDSDNVPEEDCRLEAMADQLIDLTNSLNIERFAFGGLSVGGNLAQLLALKYPEKVAALIIMDSTADEEPEESKAKYFAMMQQTEALACIPEPMAEVLASLFFSPNSAAKKPELVQWYKDLLAGYKGDRIQTIVNMGRQIFSRPSMLQELAKIQVPCLLMTGKDDVPRPISDIMSMAQHLPNSQVHIIEDAGHTPPLEQGEVVSEKILEFLQNNL